MFQPDAKRFFDLAQPDLSVGRPRDLLDTPVWDARHVALLEREDVREAVQADQTPVPPVALREGYFGDRHLEFWLSGLADFEAVRRETPVASGLTRYLDLGGSSGRVARHAARQPGWEAWVSDINGAYIDWVVANDAAGLRAFRNEAKPPLPFPDGYFDVVSAFSVFTHIDVEEINWLLELRRIVKPGGLLFLTALEDHVWTVVKEDDWMFGSLSVGGHEDTLRSILQNGFEYDRLILRYNAADEYYCNVFYSRRYLLRRWGDLFDKVEVRPAGYQSLVLLTNPS